MAYQTKDLTGQKFSRLLALKPLEKRTIQGGLIWECQCDCGNLCEIPSARLVSSKTKSCGCLQKEFVSKLQKKPLGEASKNLVFYHKKKDAFNRKIEWNLSKEEFIEITSKSCYYCGKSPSQLLNRDYPCNGDYIHNGIDRVNNNLGYILDNCVPCCKWCNWAKSNRTTQEFYSWIVEVYNFNNLGKINEFPAEN